MHVNDCQADWRPSCSLENLRRRAEVYARIRAFFADRGVMEVDTPVLSQAAVSDPFLSPLRTRYRGPLAADGVDLYLQTSPEYAMKRLLAAGSGAIYQLAKAFRDGERGDRHNPEFCMLEWYRPGFDDRLLMNEVAELVQAVTDCGPVRSISYREAFQEYLGLDPHQATLEDLQSATRSQVQVEIDDQDRDTWLNLLLSHAIEPQLREPTFIYDFPASQAALARVEPDAEGVPVARRFELYVSGVELANGYFELTDAAEQARRFDADTQARRNLGMPTPPTDGKLVQALEHGLPSCAGVALGVDRLLMLATGSTDIAEVIAFPFERA